MNQTAEEITDKYVSTILTGERFGVTCDLARIDEEAPNPRVRRRVLDLLEERMVTEAMNIGHEWNQNIRPEDERYKEKIRCIALALGVTCAMKRDNQVQAFTSQFTEEYRKLCSHNQGTAENLTQCFGSITYTVEKPLRDAKEAHNTYLERRQKLLRLKAGGKPGL